jgi:hypothetical protein
VFGAKVDGPGERDRTRASHEADEDTEPDGADKLPAGDEAEAIPRAGTPAAVHNSIVLRISS